MQWYVYLTMMAATALLWKVADELVMRPIHAVLRLRREALARMLSLRSVSLPQPRETANTSREIRAYDQAVRDVRTAQYTFADLGARFLAFGENEPTICALMALIGFDIARAGHELIDLSQIYVNARCDSEFHHQIGDAFAATTAALTTSRCHTQNDMIKIRLEPMRLGNARRPRRLYRPPVRQRSASHAH